MERHVYDENQPQGTKSLSNLRNAIRSLFQADLMPLRCRASWKIDDMEYSTQALAQAEWSGTGCTVDIESTNQQEGNFAVEVAVDATGDRTVSRSLSMDLSDYISVKVWERSDGTSEAIKFFLSDGANTSYWDITTHGTADTWKQDTLTLASPDSNSGSPCDLESITSFGFSGLDADATYLFDTIKAVVGMTVAVDTSHAGSFYKNVYVGSSPLETAKTSAPTLTAPSANPRIDILTINSSGTLAWITGSEGATPSADWASITSDVIPLCMVYCKTTMTSVLDYEDKDTDSNQGYIYADVRPLYKLGVTSIADLTDVVLSSLSDGDTLVYSSASTRWENGGGIPSGLIAMWSGSLASIPSGWSLCDGTGGTPNLLSRFAMGVPDALTDPGDTGGSSTATLAETNLPSHTHSIGNESSHTHGDGSYSADSVGNHRHNIAGIGNSGEHGTPSGTLWNATSSKYTEYAGGHSHGVSGTSGSGSAHNHSCGSVGSGTAFSILPSYYKVAFIMKD